MVIAVQPGTNDYGEPFLSLEVQDTATGIPDSARNQIFDIFIQAKPHTHFKHSGSGLGLTLSRQLNKGSTFVATFLVTESLQQRLSSQPLSLLATQLKSSEDMMT